MRGVRGEHELRSQGDRERVSGVWLRGLSACLQPAHEVLRGFWPSWEWVGPNVGHPIPAHALRQVLPRPQGPALPCSWCGVCEFIPSRPLAGECVVGGQCSCPAAGSGVQSKRRERGCLGLPWPLPGDIICAQPHASVPAKVEGVAGGGD